MDIIRQHVSLVAVDLAGRITCSRRMVNDANAGCLAEARNDENLRDAVYLSLSNSVGSAILIDRSLYLGHNMRSGEVGHATLFRTISPTTAARTAAWTPTAARACGE